MTVPGYDTYTPRPLARPLTLTLGFFGALLAGLASAVGAVLLIADAHELARQTAAGILPTDGSLDELASAAIDDAANTLVFRGILGLVSAVLVLAVALAVRNGRLWARIVLTVLLLGGLCANGIAVRDVTPGVTKLLDVAAILVSVLVVVLLFLPPTNRYAKARLGR